MAGAGLACCRGDGHSSFPKSEAPPTFQLLRLEHTLNAFLGGVEFRMGGGGAEGEGLRGRG